MEFLSWLSEIVRTFQNTHLWGTYLLYVLILGIGLLVAYLFTLWIQHPVGTPCEITTGSEETVNINALATVI